LPLFNPTTLAQVPSCTTASNAGVDIWNAARPGLRCGSRCESTTGAGLPGEDRVRCNHGIKFKNPTREKQTHKRISSCKLQLKLKPPKPRRNSFLKDLGSNTNLEANKRNLLLQALDCNSNEETHNESRSSKLQIATQTKKPTMNLAQASPRLQHKRRDL
jgi:hypothetical protein